MVSKLAQNMKSRFGTKPRLLSLTALVLALGAVGVMAAKATGNGKATLASATAANASAPGSASATSSATARAALTVTLVHPQTIDLSRSVQANGNVTPWQESQIGAELANLRIDQVRVNVGDKVKKGDLLASFADEGINIDIDQAGASVAENQAQHHEALENLNRMKQLAENGAFSRQQMTTAITQENVARAKMQMAVAKLSMEKLHKKQSRVLAPDDGVISARSANVGAVAQAGQELFRLVRQGRLEWRAEVGVNDVAAISNGAKVRLQVTSGKSVTGVVRSIGPGVDTHTRNVLVYVDLPDAAGQGLKPGMFLQGDIQIGSSKALVVPASSVVLRDGVANVFVANDKLVVQQVAVKVGRESGALVEIQGIAPDAKVVANGAAFLADGDLVRIASDSKTAAPLKVAGKYGTS